ncbi:MAG: GtrA family protein [Christensenella sp.]|nr:MAG: GtrA family protein [Christensenella sp.]
MDENKTVATDEIVEPIEDRQEQIEIAQTAQTDESQVQEKPAKKKAKLPKGLQKLVDKINANENVRQMVVFTLFSFICGGSQLILTLVLTQLKYAGGVLAEPFKGIPVGNFSIFGYETTAEFIGFLVGSITGQVLTFVLNRKKTFNCTNNVVISGIMYTILAVFIIFMQTLLGGAITSACYGAMPEPSSFVGLLFNLAGQAVGGIAALVISFLGNKFLVMRNWGSKKATAETTDSAPTEEN